MEVLDTPERKRKELRIRIQTVYINIYIQVPPGEESWQAIVNGNGAPFWSARVASVKQMLSPTDGSASMTSTSVPEPGSISLPDKEKPITMPLVGPVRVEQSACNGCD